MTIPAGLIFFLSVTRRARNERFPQKERRLGRHEVWIEVAEAIDHQVKNKRCPTYQETVTAAS